MAHNNSKTIKAVTVSVTYHRNCLVVVDEDDDNIEEQVRNQIRMPGDPILDPSEWSEDEFAVIVNDDIDIQLQTKKIKPIKPKG